MDIQTKLQQGIAAAQAGQKVEARRVLIEVVEADENQLAAWQWLSRVVDSLEEKTVCLENILTLDPCDQAAQDELERVKTQQAALYRPLYVEEEQPPVETISTSPSAVPARDEFDNEWLCPYCTALTTRADKRCPKCRQSLLISKPVNPERSTWLWRGIFLQLATILYLLVAGAAIFVLAGKGRGVSNPLPLLPIYLGLPVSQPAALNQALLHAFPRWLFWSFGGAIIYSLGLLALLYGRVRYGNILYLLNAAATLILVSTGIYYYHSSLILLLFCLIGLLFGIAQLSVALLSAGDFSYKTVRLRLRADKGVKHHTSFFQSGRRYSERGMWGAAIIHFRRAIAGDPSKLPYRLALVVAYLKVARYDLARKELDEAKKLAPHASDIYQLEKTLTSM